MSNELAEIVSTVRDKIVEQHREGKLKDDELKLALALVNGVATTIRKLGNIDDQLTRIANVLEKIEEKL